MLERVTGQVERTPGGGTPYAVFFKLDGVIIGQTEVHEIEEGEAMISHAFEYLQLISQEAEDEAFLRALNELTAELLKSRSAG